jgi:DNA-binding beta-propeller fold protein YncE
VLTAHDNTELTAIDVGNGPRGVAFDGTNIWVTNLDDDTVSKIIAS